MAMPEGDTIHHAAARIRPILQGHVPDELHTPHPRFGRDRWAERLAGRAVRSVDAHGKHLFLRDTARVLRLLRDDDQTRPVGDALLDQRSVAGIGNLWKCEACWEAQVDPWRTTGATSDAQLLALLAAVRPRMQASAAHGTDSRDNRVYGRAGRACRRCGALIEVRGQGDGNRPTYWCPGCQR